MKGFCERRFFTLIVSAIIIQGINGQCSDSLSWMRESMLDRKGKMVIKWNFTDDDITMMMTGKTKGYLALGFSPTKGWTGADVVVGWVKDGMAYLQDRINQDENDLILDENQSFELLEGGEDDTHTFICFQRKLNTCDLQDFNISKGTTNVVWSLNEKDPDSPNGSLQYSTSENGFKFEYLLGVAYPRPTSETLETLHIRSPSNVTVKSETGNTLYWCNNFKYPAFDSKRYMVGFKTLIPENNMEVVHHALLYRCEPEDSAKVFSEVDPNGYNCLDPQTTKFQTPCNDVLAVWGMGIIDQYFPTGLALPFGSTTEEFYLKLEFHYNILPKRQGASDNSSMQVFITKDPPKHEMGLMFLGSESIPIQLIPPRQKAFSLFGICEDTCLQKLFPKEGSIYVTGIKFYAHMSARKMRLRIFRNGTEIEPLWDDYYDFDYQVFRFLKEEVQILTSDILVTECIYDTSDRNTTTINSPPLEQEMCFSNIIYYPRIDLTWCVSFPDPKKILKLTGIEQLAKDDGSGTCQSSHCKTAFHYPGLNSFTKILLPEELSNRTLGQYMMNFNGWTADKVEDLKKIYLEAQYPVCLTDYTPIDEKDLGTVKYPSDAQTYTFPEPCSSQENVTTVSY